MLPESNATGISTSTIHIRHTSTSALKYQDRYFHPFAGGGIAVLPTVLLFGLALVPGTPSTLDFLTGHSGLLFQFLFCCHGHAVDPGELILLGDSRTGYTNYFLYSGAFPIAKLPLPVTRRPVLSSWLTSGSCTFHFPSYTSPLSFPERELLTFGMKIYLCFLRQLALDGFLLNAILLDFSLQALQVTLQLPNALQESQERKSSLLFFLQNFNNKQDILPTYPVSFIPVFSSSFSLQLIDLISYS